MTFSVQMTGTIIGALLNCTQCLIECFENQFIWALADVIMQTVVRNERTILVSLHVNSITRKAHIVSALAQQRRYASMEWTTNPVLQCQRYVIAS